MQTQKAKPRSRFFFSKNPTRFIYIKVPFFLLGLLLMLSVGSIPLTTSLQIPLVPHFVNTTPYLSCCLDFLHPDQTTPPPTPISALLKKYHLRLPARNAAPLKPNVPEPESKFRLAVKFAKHLVAILSKLMLALIVSSNETRILEALKSQDAQNCVKHFQMHVKLLSEPGIGIKQTITPRIELSIHSRTPVGLIGLQALPKQTSTHNANTIEPPVILYHQLQKLAAKHRPSTSRHPLLLMDPLGQLFCQYQQGPDSRLIQLNESNSWVLFHFPDALLAKPGLQVRQQVQQLTQMLREELLPHHIQIHSCAIPNSLSFSPFHTIRFQASRMQPDSNPAMTAQRFTLEICDAQQLLGHPLENPHQLDNRNFWVPPFLRHTTTLAFEANPSLHLSEPTASWLARLSKTFVWMAHQNIAHSFQSISLLSPQTFIIHN
jgi:hypothetical protein